MGIFHENLTIPTGLNSNFATQCNMQPQMFWQTANFKYLPHIISCEWILQTSSSNYALPRFVLFCMQFAVTKED